MKTSIRSIVVISFLAVAAAATTAAAQEGQTQPPPQPTNPFTDEQMEYMRKMLADQPKLFEFHIYFRAGFGVNSKGGAQQAFGLPGTGNGSKYRLGNETEMYSEPAWVGNWLNPDRGDPIKFSSMLMVSIISNRDQDFDLVTAFAVRQAFVEATKLSESQPDLSVWAGQRFYRRRDVHINDFFFQDTSGPGAGFQDYNMGFGKLAIAYRGSSAQNATGVNPSVGRFAKNSLDVRFYDIALGPGKLELWLFPSFIKGDDDVGIDSRAGFAGGLYWNLPVSQGFNEIAAQFGYGAAANFNANIDLSIDKKGWQARFLDRGAIELGPMTSLGYTAIFQLDNRDGPANGDRGDIWVSAGVRPIYHFTKHWAIQGEAGVDIVKGEEDGATTNLLGKVTLAPTLRAGPGFWSRPELRLFVTAAFWNDDVKGQVGGTPFADDTFGMSFGVQCENWF